MWGPSLLHRLSAGGQASSPMQPACSQRLLLAGPAHGGQLRQEWNDTEKKEQNRSRGRPRRVSKEEAGGRQRLVPLRSRAGSKRQITETQVVKHEKGPTLSQFLKVQMTA